MTSYLPFFSGTATVAGALVGLLFVALSVAPERLRGAHASVEHQAIAATAFTALVDALFVSLIGLQPGGGLAYGAVILGAVGLSSSCGLAVKLWRARGGGDLSRRWPFLLGFIIAVYVAQVISGIVGIARSWELLGLEGGGPLDLLAKRLGAREPLARPGPPVPEPAPDGNEQAGSRAVTKPVRAHCSCRDSMLVVHRCFPITPPPRS